VQREPGLYINETMIIKQGFLHGPVLIILLPP